MLCRFVPVNGPDIAEGSSDCCSIKCGTSSDSARNRKHYFGECATANSGGVLDAAAQQENCKQRLALLLASRNFHTWQPQNASFFKQKDDAGAESSGSSLAKSLLEAVRTCDFKAVVDLVSDGAPVDARYTRKCTPLMLTSMANRDGATEVMDFLLDAAASLDLRDDDGMDALLHACRNSNKNAVKQLLRRKADLHSRSSDGRTGPMMAVQDHCENLVHYLLGKRAPINAKSENGWNILHYACSERLGSLVPRLLESKADPIVDASDGTTALMLSAELGDARVCGLLVHKSALLNATNLEGNNVLMVALAAGHKNISTWLLDKGADPNCRNQHGETAEAIARGAGYRSLVELIQNLSFLRRNKASSTQLANDDEDSGENDDNLNPYERRLAQLSRYEKSLFHYSYKVYDPDGKELEDVYCKPISQKEKRNDDLIWSAVESDSEGS